VTLLDFFKNLNFDFFKNRKPVFWMVIAFLGLLALFLANEARADSTTQMSVGATVLSGQFSSGFAIDVTERFGGKWDLSVGWTSDQICRCGEGEVEVESYMFVKGQRIVQLKGFELGLGAGYVSETNRVFGQNLVYALSIGYNFDGGISVIWDHFSNGGTASPNLGQDTLTFGYRF